MFRALLPVLFGAAFTVSISVAMGSLLLRWLRIPLHRLEATLFAFVSGAACLSFATFLLCLVHQATRNVFLSGGLALILCAVWKAWGEPRRKVLPPAPPGWVVLFGIVFATFWLAYFFTALAPEVSPDGSGYHLGNVARYWRNHGFVWEYHSMYSYLSQGLEMLFLVAFSFGGHSSAALVHFAFLTALPLLMACYGRRFGFPRAGLFAGIVAFTCPIAGLSGTFAYNDLAVATLLFAVFYLLQVNNEVSSGNQLIIIGLLSGFCYATKYTAFLALPFAVASLAGSLRGRRLLVVPAASAVMIAPWVLRNWFWVGNPFAPFLNRWFPNPYFHAGSEASYLADLRHYEGINHFWEIPLQLTLHGRLISGMIGPVLLLAPFALLALRHPHGRRLLAAACVFAIPAWFNTGARFLLPAIPFLSMAMGIAFGNSRGVLPALAVFEAVVCWPSILSLYCDPVSWRLRSVPVRAALRLEPESQFLAEHLREYGLIEPIRHEVPPGGKIFSYSTRPEAYLDRDIIVSYESSLGNLVQDILSAPLFHSPDLHRRFRFAARPAEAVRLVQYATDDAHWNIAEVRLYSQGRELSGSSSWRFSATPNPAEAYLAFDGRPVTRWSTWQPMTANCRLQVEFGREETIDEVVLEGPMDRAQVTVEVLSGGVWTQAAAGASEQFRSEPPSDLRRAASRELKGRGIDYLMIDPADATGRDMNERPADWGIVKIAEAHGTILYRMD